MRTRSLIGILVAAAFVAAISCATQRGNGAQTSQMDFDSPRVNFAFEDADVHLIINAISKISGANIITTPELAGKVTLHCRDVSWKFALEKVVKPLGFEVVEEERGILRIVAAKKKQRVLVRKEFQLKHIRPDFPPSSSPGVFGESIMLKRLRAMLSSDGRLEYVHDKNIILLRDAKPLLQKISEAIKALDVKPEDEASNDKGPPPLAPSSFDDFGIGLGRTGEKRRS